MGTRRFALFVGLLIAIGAVPLGSPQPVAAVVSVTTLGTPITQNFDTLPATGSATWANDSTLNGWYHARTGTGTTIVANNGSSNAGNLYSYGCADTVTAPCDVAPNATNNRALGSLGSGNAAVGNLFWGIELVNNSGSTITSLDVSYTGEQWRNSAAAAQTVAFSYLVGAPTVSGTLLEFQSAGVPVTQLDFTSPITGGTATHLNGNLAANRVTLTHSITGLSIPNGTEVMLRWSDPDHTGSDHGLSIDDFSVTPQGAVAPGTTLSISDVTQNETNAGTTTFTFAVTLSAAAGAGGVTFDIATADGTAQDDNPATEDNDYVAQSLTGQSIPEASSGPYNFNVTVNGDTTVETNETFFVNVTNVVGATVADGQGLGTITNDDVANACGDAYTPIYQIQGSSTSVPTPGNVTTEGVVVGDFQGPAATGAQGFFIQDPAGDGNTATSDGIYVFTGSATGSPSVGDRVRVGGYARERFSQSTINGSNSDTSATTDIQVCSTGNAVTPTSLTMPFTAIADLERYEGMYVIFPETLVVAEYFNYARFGEIVLAEPLTGEARPYSGTAIDEPGAAANARTAANLLRRIMLDDGVEAQNPPYLRHPDGAQFTLSHYFRGGDQVTNAVGVLGYAFSLYRLYPTAGATYAAVNPRPAAPADTGGRITVAAQNTLNYFLTPDIDPTGPGDNVCGGNANLECRGWDSNQPAEFQRQRDKLIATLIGLDADVIGLNEIENTPGVEPAADIVAGMNAILGAGTYNYIDTGVIGTDAIRVGMIYRTAAVHPIGHPAILTSAVDPRFIDTRSRPVLAQTFQEVETNALFTVAVNHLKSKGSACSGDPDAGDGQGNCNGTRTLAAQALVDWLNTDPTNSGDSDFLIIGDLNAYAMEDPIDAIKAGPDDTASTADDYTNLVAQFLGTYAYSYVFDGQFGYLDHALSSAGLTGQVTGVAEWHINADEAPVFDYDTSFKPNEQDALYEPAAYRSSDHDAVVVGLNLSAECDTAPFSDVPVDHPFCPLINWAKVNGITTGYADGTFGPSSDITRQAMAAFLTRLAGATPGPCTAEPFTDVPTDHSFCPEIDWLEANNIANGYEDGTFRPSRNVTRQAMAAFLARIVGATLESCPPPPPYSDVSSDHAFCAEIKWLHNSGITNGFEDGTYRPAENITRQAMAAFLARTAYWVPLP